MGRALRLLACFGLASRLLLLGAKTDLQSLGLLWVALDQVFSQLAKKIRELADNAQDKSVGVKPRTKAQD